MPNVFCLFPDRDGNLGGHFEALGSPTAWQDCLARAYQSVVLSPTPDATALITAVYNPRHWFAYIQRHAG